MADRKILDVDNPLNGMYEEYFLDYASYVILERAVPHLYDGFKPVQRRILHSMKEMDDGRYHKVANIIGQTMQYHPHGDAAIGDALVNLGQKDLLIDTQGNWGDVRTGDSAAASRYIEARLTKFALDVIFNPDTTEYQLSYDGRKKEPITLPVKFPMVLAQGVDGIAVGLSTKILPHNFCELCEAAIAYLNGKKKKLYPDFLTGGSIDVSDYNDGKRGGRVKVRASIEKIDKKHIAIREIPYGVTTTSLIDSVLKAVDKGKIKIKRIVDNTAQEVEIMVELSSGVSPDVTIDALYAFTNCEVSISPNACIVVDDKPVFMNVTDVLHLSTDRTRQLLKSELEIEEADLEAKWHFSSLEKIFIQERIYHDIEECESWEEVLEAVEAGLLKYVQTPTNPKPSIENKIKLKRDISEEDITRLTEIRIKRISKYNVFKAEEALAKILEDLEKVRHHLNNLTTYTIDYYQRILDKYGPGRERKTKIVSFGDIDAAQVVANNAKLYVDYKEGFIGHGLRKAEFVSECSDIDDIIVLRKDGNLVVTRIADKTFVGKNILYAGVWRKGDDRTTYNMIYLDAKSSKSYAKRFHVKSITRDREYNLISDAHGSRVHHLTINPNGEAEVVDIQLTQSSSARKKRFEYDFAELDIKGRSAKGNTITKYPINKISIKEVGKSTLGALHFWIDEASGRLNTEERGRYVGDFDTDDFLLVVYKDGEYELATVLDNKKFEYTKIHYIYKFNPEDTFAIIYYDGNKKWSLVKRFEIEPGKEDTRYPLITEHNSSLLLYFTNKTGEKVQFSYTSKGDRISDVVDLDDFVAVRGWKALGNKLSDYKVKIGKVTHAEKLQPGDSIDFDLDENGQAKMFD